MKKMVPVPFKVIFPVFMLLLFALPCRAAKTFEQYMENLKNKENAALRREAVVGLRNFKTEESLKALVGALKDPDFSVRSNACESLGRVRDKYATPYLVKTLLKDKVDEVRISAAVAIGYIKDPKALKGLLSSLKKDKSQGVKISVATILGNLRDNSSIPGLVKALSDEDPVIRETVAKALGKLHDPKSEEGLLSVMNDSSKDVRLEAIVSLGKIRSKRAEKALSGFLDNKEEDKFIRLQSAASLGLIGNKTGFGFAKGCLEDEDPRVRIAAIQALGDIGDKDIVPVLRDMYVNTKDSDIKNIIMISLVKLGVPLKDLAGEKK